MAFRPDKLTMKSQEAVQKAQQLASEKGHQRLEPMHLLAALLDAEQPVVRDLLHNLGVDPSLIARAAEEGLNSLPKVSGGETVTSPELGKVLETASSEADAMGDQYITVEHLILALAKVKSKAQDLLGALGVGEKDVRTALPKIRGRTQGERQQP